MTMEQNLLKYQATSVITIIIKLCLETKLISSINYYPMKGKPLINQANLQKISKTQQFLIRGKPNFTRSHRQQKSQKNIQPDNIYLELDQCCEILDSSLFQDKPLTHEQAGRLQKLLMLFKNRSTLMESSSLQDQLEESSPLMIRHSQSKYFGRIKNDIQEEKGAEACVQKSIFETSKIKNNKLKLGKQNNFKSAVLLQIKIEKLQARVSEQQQLLQQQRVKIEQIHQQISELSLKNEQLEAQNLNLHLHQVEMQSKLDIVSQKNKQIESDLSSKSVELEIQIEELTSTIQILSWQLREREAEIVALFRKQL